MNSCLSTPTHVTVPKRAFTTCDELVRRHIDYDTLYTLIRALIMSRLDYCNSLFVCSSQSTLSRLQRVQDAARRLLCDVSPRSHASSLRKRLHWLPVSSRIQFKLCILTFDIQHGIASLYLAELCDRCDNTRVRSAARGNSAVRQTRASRLGQSFFSSCAAGVERPANRHQAD